MDHPALITFYVIIGILAIVGIFSGFKYWKDSKAWRKQRNDDLDSRYSNSAPQELASPSQGSCHDRSPPPGVWNGVFGARRRSTVTPGAAESGLGKHIMHITPRRASVRAGIVNSGHSMSMHPGTLVFTDSGRPPPVPRAVVGRYANLEDSAKSTPAGDRTSITTKTNPNSTTKVFDVATSRVSGPRLSNGPLQSSKQDPIQELTCPSQEAVGEVVTARLVDIKHVSSLSVKAARVIPLFHKKTDDRIGQSDRVELPAHRVEDPNETPISPSQSEIGERNTSNQDPQDVLVSPQSSRVGHSSLGRIAEDAIVSPCSNDKQRRWSWSADDDSAVRGRP